MLRDKMESYKMLKTREGRKKGWGKNKCHKQQTITNMVDNPTISIITSNESHVNKIKDIVTVDKEKEPNYILSIRNPP